MYLVKTPQIIRSLFPNFLWSKKETDKVLYLTFDDGPIPEVTPWVLEQLAAYNAKATFFCVGDNVKKYPGIYAELREAGHAVGNHTHNHLSGWGTKSSTYVDNVEACAEYIDSDLFRPPYGRLKPKQAEILLKRYKIVMWDVLSGDFDETLSGEQCLQNVLRNTENGSVIVFHDSVKARKRLEYSLPKVLKYYSDRGYRFAALTYMSKRKAELQSV